MAVFSGAWLRRGLKMSSPMSVKEVLQSLVDDNMVDCERVGSSNYYWAFPSKALHARKRKLDELEKQVLCTVQRTAGPLTFWLF
ncbi:hypothetical protein MATL_G00193760 [Megalops atlanticus]|uniref:Mnd1 HTH domain-containing protein n=1 Tax=Megalops atlanticus TaxID=7932 RepID=A0A9D3PLE4_MEGAT|nr:hypothetical protein MATL_G00193760 [Megalops atlanticus]